MVRPQELVDSVVYSLRQADGLPDTTEFVGYEPDINSEPIKLPLVEVSLSAQVEINESNTDFIDYQYDDAGKEIGKIYESLYRQELTVAAWTAHESRYSPRDMGNAIRDTLYQHTTVGPDIPLRHPDDDRTVDEVWELRINEGAHTDDLGTSPTLRRWEQTIDIAASEQYITEPSQPPIERVTELFDTDNDGDIDLELAVE